MKSKMVKELAKKLLTGAGVGTMALGPVALIAEKPEKKKKIEPIPEKPELLIGGLGEDSMDEDIEQEVPVEALEAALKQKKTSPDVPEVNENDVKEEQIRQILKGLMK
jgi:hypothetical protein